MSVVATSKGQAERMSAAREQAEVSFNPATDWDGEAEPSNSQEAAACCQHLQALVDVTTVLENYLGLLDRKATVQDLIDRAEAVADGSLPRCTALTLPGAEPAGFANLTPQVICRDILRSGTKPGERRKWAKEASKKRLAQ